MLIYNMDCCTNLHVGYGGQQNCPNSRSNNNQPFNLHPEKWFEGYPVKSTLFFQGVKTTMAHIFFWFMKPSFFSGCHPRKSQVFLPKTFGKIETASTIFWDYLGMFREYSQKNIFFRNKTLLFFKIESWNFQNLFENKFCETPQRFNTFS